MQWWGNTINFDYTYSWLCLGTMKESHLFLKKLKKAFASPQLFSMKSGLKYRLLIKKCCLLSACFTCRCIVIIRMNVLE